MYGEPELWHALLRPARRRSPWRSCGSRSTPGVSAVQLFDSWAGALSEADYRAYVLPHSAAVLGGLAERRRAADPLRGGHRRCCWAPWARRAPTWSGVDWRTPLDAATERIGPDRAVQGNLDKNLTLSIKDNGKGFSASKSPAWHGPAHYEIARPTHQEQIDFTSAEGKGALVSCALQAA